MRNGSDIDSSPDNNPVIPQADVESRPRVTAETMAAKQRDISVSEFFAKNRHLLGFDNPRKALLTTVKEAVDNSLDACEEAGILPEVWVKIEAMNGGSRGLPLNEAKTAAQGQAIEKLGRTKKDETQPALIEATNPELAQPVAPSIANATR